MAQNDQKGNKKDKPKKAVADLRDAVQEIFEGE